MGRAGNVKAKEPPERRDYPPVRLMKGRWLTAQVLPVLNPDSLEACFCFDCSPKSHFRGATALIGGRAEPHTSIERLSLRAPPTCLRQVCLHAPTKCLLVIAVNNEWPQWAFHQSEKQEPRRKGESLLMSVHVSLFSPRQRRLLIDAHRSDQRFHDQQCWGNLLLEVMHYLRYTLKK